MFFHCRKKLQIFSDIFIENVDFHLPSRFFYGIIMIILLQISMQTSGIVRISLAYHKPDRWFALLRLMKELEVINMGLIRAAAGAVGGTLADSWLEYITAG